MNAAYLLTGSNIGDRASMLAQARESLGHTGNITKSSHIYETEAWGLEGLPAHLNQALLLHTELSAVNLLHNIHDIENQLGRQRQLRWGVRSIDIDIIFFNEEIYELPHLIIPHPLMQERNFVLAPLTEIVPDYLHPVLHQTVATLLSQCPDPLKVAIWTGPADRNGDHTA
jgi:2-amino-4-hydroxy-6-hydroxymethyldihydropteridine diphosphokinase